MTETLDLPRLDSLRDIPAVMAAMTVDEKLAQLIGLWLNVTGDADGASVAPMQHEMLAQVYELDYYISNGLGQLTRPLGSRVVPAGEMVETLRDIQRQIVARSRFGIPALAHEEILTGLQLYGATTYPSPLAWGSSWNVELVERMGAQIGLGMRALGVHLGLAPVLDLVRDPRWGRVEECISEDPYLVGVLGASYVSGVQSAGVGATLKHFLAYSGSQAGRNLAPVHAGPREVLEQFAVPFEMVVKLARPSSVMHSYAEIDGVPVAADPRLLTGLLRDRWGFEGTVVADYFGVAFLETLHDVVPDIASAAITALAAGVDVELPTGHAYLQPLRDALEAGAIDISFVDGAVERVLRQKVELGVMNDPSDGPIELDSPVAREIARQLADESIVLLQNDGLLPLTGQRRIALIGPNAHSAEALMGNYSFTNHVEVPAGTPLGIEVSTVLEALRRELPDIEVTHAAGCAIRADQEDPAEAAAGIRAAVSMAQESDVAVLVVGDRAGLFGRGTVGEGSDTDDLRLPGRQGDLVDAVLATGTPVVLVLLTGRAYPIGRWSDQVSAVVQAFFPGEEGAQAIAGVLVGRLNPSGRLPLSMPKSSGSQPYAYLAPRLGGDNMVSSVDPAPLFAFGHGLSYTTFEHSALHVGADRWDTSGTLVIQVDVRNSGDRAGTDVVQLYVRDRFASVTRPMRQLLGWARVSLEAADRATVRFTVPAGRLALVSRDLRWQVEPGEFDLIVAPSVAAEGHVARVELGGDTVTLGEDRPLLTVATIVREG